MPIFRAPGALISVRPNCVSVWSDRGKQFMPSSTATAILVSKHKIWSIKFKSMRYFVSAAANRTVCSSIYNRERSNQSKHRRRYRKVPLLCAEARGTQMEQWFYQTAITLNQSGNHFVHSQLICECEIQMKRKMLTFSHSLPLSFAHLGLRNQRSLSLPNPLSANYLRCHANICFYFTAHNLFLSLCFHWQQQPSSRMWNDFLSILFLQPLNKL